MRTETTNLLLIAIILIPTFWVGARALDNVGQYQMDAMWNCGWVYSEPEHQKWCRNELDGFGSLYDGGQ